MPLHPHAGGPTTLTTIVPPYATWTDNDFVHGLTASFMVILVSELGDKTFFIAAILSMKHARLTVLAGAMLALGSMHCLSAMLGLTSMIIPRWITYYLSSLLFALFGLKMLKEGYSMTAEEEQEEFEETKKQILSKEDEMRGIGMNQATDLETGLGHVHGLGMSRSVSSPALATGSQMSVCEQLADPSRCMRRSWLYRTLLACCSRVFLEAFVLTFLAEWGDRSQMTTIVLAARESVLGVIMGGLIGHTICTGLAVLGGRLVTQRISVRSVTLIGGVVFLFFALSVFFIPPDSNS